MSAVSRLLNRTTSAAGAATLVAVGLAAGVALAATTLDAGPDVVTVVGAASTSSASGNPSPHGRALGHDKSGSADKGKPDQAGTKAAADADEPGENAANGDGGAHGRCVAAVARNHDATRGPHHNHGGAVSRAAQTCPNPSPSGSAGG